MMMMMMNFVPPSSSLILKGTLVYFIEEKAIHHVDTVHSRHTCQWLQLCARRRSRTRARRPR